MSVYDYRSNFPVNAVQLLITTIFPEDDCRKKKKKQIKFKRIKTTSNGRHTPYLPPRTRRVCNMWPNPDRRGSSTTITLQMVAVLLTVREVHVSMNTIIYT